MTDGTMMHLAVSPMLDTSPDFRSLASFAQKAEAVGLDMVLLADSAPAADADTPNRQMPFEATTLLAALATVTSRIGLVAEASTVTHQPYNLARRFASLDIISHGRAGWIATLMQNPRETANLSRPEGFSDDVFSRRIEEYVGIVRRLWQGWDADALLFDKSGGRFHDPEKMHLLDHKGEFFSVRGPLNVARSPQDRPVLVMSGVSERAFDLAARSADVVLLDEAEDAKTRHDDLKRRVAASGRNPGTVKVLVNVSGARSDIDPGRLEELCGSKSCDGFNMVMPPSALGGFVEGVLPELRRRGLVHQGYPGTTLRAHLGLAGGDQ